MNERRDQIGMSIAWGAWTLAQVGWLALSAERVALAAKWPGAGEKWAAVGMVAVQLILAAAMGRSLVRDVRSWMFAVATAVPMLGLAMVMSGGRAAESVAASIFVSAWLGAIASVGSIRSAAVRAPMMGLLLTLVAGGPVFFYLTAEFARPPLQAGGALAYAVPVLGASSILLHGWGQIWTILVPIGVIAGVWSVGRVVGQKKKTHAGGVGLGGLVG